MTKGTYSGSVDLQSGEIKDGLQSAAHAKAQQMILDAPGTEPEKAMAQLMYHLHLLHDREQMSEIAFRLLKALGESAMVSMDMKPDTIFKLTEVIDAAQLVAQSDKEQLQ